MWGDFSLYINAQAAAKSEVSEALVPSLAKLFEKFHTDVEAQRTLVELTAQLDPAVFAIAIFCVFSWLAGSKLKNVSFFSRFGQQKKSLGVVLEALQRVLCDTVDTDLLFTCVDTLQVKIPVSPVMRFCCSQKLLLITVSSLNHSNSLRLSNPSFRCTQGNLFS